MQFVNNIRLFLCLTGEICMSDIKSWKPSTEMSQSTVVKSVDGVPRVQDPLGSSVMTPDDT